METHRFSWMRRSAIECFAGGRFLRDAAAHAVDLVVLAPKCNLAATELMAGLRQLAR